MVPWRQTRTEREGEREDRTVEQCGDVLGVEVSDELIVIETRIRQQQLDIESHYRCDMFVLSLYMCVLNRAPGQFRISEGGELQLPRFA